MLRFIEDRFVFQPATFAQSWREPDPELRATDVELPTPGFGRCHAWWCPPLDWQPSHGAALYCHGTGGNLSHRGNGVRRWQTLLGLAVLIIDYPGYGRSEGKPSEPGCYAAAEAALDWLQSAQRVAPENVVLHGGSLGAAIAVEMAHRHSHRALVLVSAFTSLRDMAQVKVPLPLVRGLIRNRFDNLGKIGKCAGPVLIAHGTDDRVIPFRQGERLFAAAQEPKRFHRMDGYDHHHTPGPAFYDELRELLAATAAK